MGADRVVNVTRERIAQAQADLGMVEGFDVALEMSGHPSAVAELIENCNHGAKVAMLGLPSGPFEIDGAKVITHMLTLKGIYGREMYDKYYRSMDTSFIFVRDYLRSYLALSFTSLRCSLVFSPAFVATLPASWASIFHLIPLLRPRIIYSVISFAF